MQVPAILPSVLKPRFAYPLLAVLCLALWLPGLIHLPPLDRDDARYAQAARQMEESGNYLEIRFDQARLQSPPGIYWAEAAMAKAAHALDLGKAKKGIWPYRLPSLLGGIASVWLTFWIGSLMSAEAGALAALLMAFSVLLSATAMVAGPDTLLLACVLLMQGVLLKLYRGDQVPLVQILLGWAALALGILLKGAAAAGVAMATIATLSLSDGLAGRQVLRWLRQTRPFFGVPLALLLIAPWLISLVHAHRYGFTLSLRNYLHGFVGPGHSAPPGYHFVLSTALFWPAILFVVPAVGAGLRNGRDPAVRFLLAWSIGWWLVVEFIPHKLPDAVLPAYPALALLAALWLLAPREKQRVLFGLSALQFLLGLVALTLTPIFLARLYGASLGVGFYLFLAGLVGLAALMMAETSRLMALSLSMAAFLILLPAVTVGMPARLDQLWLSQKLAGLIENHAKPGDPLPSLAGFSEPSLVFALNARANVVSPVRAANLGAYLGGLALVADDRRETFLKRLEALHSDAQALARVTGFDYASARKVRVTLYRVRQLVFEAPPPEE